LSAILISGIVSGSLYALLALGLILIFGSTRMLNFAQGAVGAIGALTAASLTSSSSSPAAIAGVIILGIAISAAVNILVYLVCVRLIERRGSEPIATMVTTLGATLVIEGVLQWRFGLNPLSFNMFGTAAVNILGLRLPIAGIGIVASAWLGFAIYGLVLTRTTLGLKLRMSASNSTLADLSGINPLRFRLAVWAFSGGLAAWAMMLLAAYQNIGTVSLDSLVLVSAIAASWGAFRSPTLTVLGAITLGIVTDIAARYVSTVLTSTLSAALLILVFQVRSWVGARPVDILAGNQRRRMVRPWHAARRWVSGVEWAVLSVVAFILVLGAALFEANQVSAIATTTVALVAFAWSVRFCGRLNLAIPMYMAVGGYLSAILTTEHVPSIVALIVALAATGAVSVLIRLLTWNVEPVLYVVVTLSLTAAIPELADLLQRWTGGENGLTVPPLFGQNVLLDPRSVAFQATIVMVVVGGLFVIAATSRYGAKTAFSATYPRLASGLGLRVGAISLVNELVIGVIAAIAGVLTVNSSALVVPDSFSSDVAIYYLMAVIIGGGWTFAGIVVGAAFLILVPQLTSSLSAQLPNIVYGVGLVIFALFFGEGVEGGLADLYRFVGGRARGRGLRLRPSAPGTAASSPGREANFIHDATGSAEGRTDVRS
jgi:sulfate-transporting ATPase